MSKKIESVTIGIAVKDVKEATKWYKSLVGNVETMEPAPGTVELQLTDTAWLQLDDTGYLKVGGGSAVVRLQTDDIEAAHELAEKLASDVDDIETVEGVVKYFDFKDPSGNRLSYVQML
jgi:predicted enzyme related to lactoylglutathione lyase